LTGGGREDSKALTSRQKAKEDSEALNGRQKTRAKRGDISFGDRAGPRKGKSRPATGANKSSGEGYQLRNPPGLPPACNNE